MPVLTYAGDALWVAALTIMASASRAAWRRTEPGVRVPLMGARLSRPLAFWTLPAGAFLLSLWFAYTARTSPAGGDAAMILFGVRALTASLLALLHLRWVKAALQGLDRDGALKP